MKRGNQSIRSPRNPARLTRRNRGASQGRSLDRSTYTTAAPAARPITSLTSRQRREKQRANDTDRYVLAAQSGQVAGAATEKPGLAAHRPKRPAVCVLPEGPCPGSPDRTHGAGRSLQARIFMPRKGGVHQRAIGSSVSAPFVETQRSAGPGFVDKQHSPSALLLVVRGVVRLAAKCTPTAARDS
jgi:hypothetical protein